MGVVRRIILAVMSKERAAAAEAESRQWMIRCRSCGFEVSVWDAGGLRAGASGRPVYRARCRGCGQRTTHDVARQEA